MTISRNFILVTLAALLLNNSAAFPSRADLLLKHDQEPPVLPYTRNKPSPKRLKKFFVYTKQLDEDVQTPATTANESRASELLHGQSSASNQEVLPTQEEITTLDLAEEAAEIEEALAVILPKIQPIWKVSYLASHFMETSNAWWYALRGLYKVHRHSKYWQIEPLLAMVKRSMDVHENTEQAKLYARVALEIARVYARKQAFSYSEQKVDSLYQHILRVKQDTLLTFVERVYVLDAVFPETSEKFVALVTACDRAVAQLYGRKELAPNEADAIFHKWVLQLKIRIRMLKAEFQQPTDHLQSAL